MSDRAHRVSDAPSPGGATDGQRQAEEVARAFHEAYERLAPSFGYATRPESAVPWGSVPSRNKRLMVATCSEVFAALLARVEAADKRAAEYACKVLEQLTELEDSQEQAAVLGERVVALETGLEQFGEHRDNCRVWNHPKFGRGVIAPGTDWESCDCGLRSALAQSEGLPPPPLDTPAKENADG